jgi:C1A family cysteine protease
MGKTVQIDGKVHGLGWLPDHPDIRDRTTKDGGVEAMLAKTAVPELGADQAPAAADLREWCPPIESQGQLNSCTAHAGVGMIEYFERKAFGKHTDASRRFLYKVTRRLGGFEGDSGAFLRNTMGAMRLFGAPPEDYWPYDEAEFDEEPPAFCYAFGQSYQATTYYRLDPPGADPSVVLASIKSHLASQLPAMFGFTVYSSISSSRPDGKVPFPSETEKVEGGHAVMAVGYDDAIEVPSGGSSPTRGAIMIRNSWGTDWGEDGYGWLPYEYVLQGLADDWWVLIAEEWVDSGEFAT